MLMMRMFYIDFNVYRILWYFCFFFMGEDNYEIWKLSFFDVFKVKGLDDYVF